MIIEGKYRFIGTRDPKQAKVAVVYLEQQRAKYEKPLPEDQEKNDAQVKVLELVEKHLAEHLRQRGFLDLDSRDNFGFYHFLAPEDFKKFGNGGNPEQVAFYNPIKQGIFVDIDKLKEPTRLYRRMLHERIHSNQLSVYGITISPRTGEVADIVSSKIGYLTTNSKEKGHEHLRLLNEANTEKLTIDIGSENQAEIISELDPAISTFNYEEPYAREVDILNAILNGIASDSDPTLVWEQLKMGVFTGSTELLRAIEQRFGRGSLRVIGNLKTAMKKGSLRTMENEAFEYFTTADKRRKDQIAIHLLREQERIHYRRLSLFTPNGFPYQKD